MGRRVTVVPALGGHVAELVDLARDGGWRGHHHLVLDARTSHPMELEAALEAGRARVLQPGGELVTEAAFVLYRGLLMVTHVAGGAAGFAVR
jgi:hypothetical protein